MAITVKKHEVKDFIRMQLYSKDPALVNRFINSILRDTMIYILGFGDGIKDEIQSPINEEEYKSAILQSALNYVYNVLVQD